MLRVVVHVGIWTAILLRWIPHRMHCTYARVHDGKLIVPFMLFVSTVSDVQAPFVQFDALINRITDDTWKVMQSVHNPPSWNMHTEVDVGAWGIYFWMGWTVRDEYMKFAPTLVTFKCCTSITVIILFWVWEHSWRNNELVYWVSVLI